MTVAKASDTSDDSRHAHPVEELHDVCKHRRKKHTCIQLDIMLCNDLQKANIGFIYVRYACNIHADERFVENTSNLTV